MHYAKPPLSIADQIQKWENRGLIITDKEYVARHLSNISFYRFRAYTYPFQNNHLLDQPFRPNITFEQILRYYGFDRELRLIVLDAIERIEVALRTQIIYQYAISEGSHWPGNATLYTNHGRFVHDWNTMQIEIRRSTEEFIKHYKRTYTSPVDPPSWMSLEVSSLGLLSKLFENLKTCPEKRAIARHFGLGSPDILASWMHTYSNIRNICAHHGRLWNRILTKSPVLPKRPLATPWLTQVGVPSNKLYINLCMMLYVLQQISPGHSIKDELRSLLSAYPEIQTAQMGFSSTWQEEALWK